MIRTNQNELVTVIVPIYNVESYLRRCIDSILCQTYSNLDIILIDDGSTDSSNIICDEYASRDGRIQVIHKNNGGVSSARNVGLKNAKGEYITFIDSDDYVEEKYVEKMYFGMQKYDVDLVVIGWKDQDGNQGYINQYVDKVHEKIYSQFDMPNLYLLYTCWGHLFKKCQINNIFFNESIYYSEDTLFTSTYFYIEENKKLLVIDDSLYIYSMDRENSAVNQEFNEKRMSMVRAYNILIDITKDYSKVNYSVKKAKKNECFLLFISLLESKKNNYKESYRFLKNEVIKLRNEGYKPKNKKENLIEILYVYFYPIFQYYLELKNKENIHDK